MGVLAPASASTGPGTVIYPAPSPVTPVVHRGYPCVLYVDGNYDQYVNVAGQTPQTRTGIAYFYSAATGQLLWRMHLRPGGWAYRQTSRGQVASSYRATINGIVCGPPA